MRDIHKILGGLILLSALVLGGCIGEGSCPPGTSAVNLSSDGTLTCVSVLELRGDTYYLPVHANSTDDPGDGTAYLYLDVVGSENRTYYDFIGDAKP